MLRGDDAVQRASAMQIDGIVLLLAFIAVDRRHRVRV
jgi:hypothetical protein